VAGSGAASGLERVVLDDRAAIYVQAHLSGVNAFCSLLLEQVAGEAGEIFTLAPRGAPRERLYQFDRGGLSPANAEALRLDQARLLRRGVERTSGAVCIVDDFSPTWGDPGSDAEANAFGVGSEVYHLLTADDDAQTFAAVLSSSSEVWHGVAAVCEQAPVRDGTQTVTPDDLAESAASVLMLTCVAYDGEGFVGWRRLNT
jgi:hypothetical protein